MYSSDETLDSGFLNATDDATPKFVGFGPRLGATLLDVLFTIPLWGTGTYFSIVSPNVVAWLVLAILGILYKPVCEKLFGATLGKMVLKLKVIGKEGTALGWGQAIMRYLPWLLGALFNMYMTYMVFQIPGIEDVDGFIELGELMAEYQAENDGAMMQVAQYVLGLLPLVSTIFLFGNKQKQAAHDILAETYVVSTKPNH